MYNLPWTNSINRTDILPPLTVRKKVKEGKDWQRAVMDSFEYIGLDQFKENLPFWDYYRMVDGKMAYQELKDVIPSMNGIQDVLNDVGVDTFLKHYDLLGLIVNNLVGQVINMSDKFTIVDLSEIAENEVIRKKTENFRELINKQIQLEVDLLLAKEGLTPENQEFQSEEEQQAFVQQLEQRKKQLVPESLKTFNKYSFKSAGLKWANATKEKDEEYLELDKCRKNEFKDKLLTGRIFREYKISLDKYYIRSWSPKNTFFSKEVSSEYVQKGAYVGRVNFMTPQEVVDEYGYAMNTETQRKLLGGNKDWRSFIGADSASFSSSDISEVFFGTPTRVPFTQANEYGFYLGLEDYLGVPMGTQYLTDKGGNIIDSYSRNLPRPTGNIGNYRNYAKVLRDDFVHRNDLCLVTEVYFKAQDLWGYLTYEDPETGQLITEQVTEDILPDFIKSNNIDVTFKESREDIVTSFEANTLKWTLRPVVYEGLKIQSANLDEPLYVYCRPCEHQIKGDTDFEVLLPVAGYIGKALAPKIMPYQSAFNLFNNQMRSLIEKELGMFVAMDLNLISSETENWGDAEEALITFRNIAKETGMFPMNLSGDGQNPAQLGAQLAPINMSVAPQIESRLRLAENAKMSAFEVAGYNPQFFMQSTKYETAEGIKMSNDMMTTQLAELFEDFSYYERKAWDLHLSVAQYCQSHQKDLTINYTKSDGSLIFLKLVDPDFPLRRFGFIASKNSKKKKALEEFKTHVIQMNTLQEDLYDLAQLRLSDTMTETMDVLRRAREYREEQAELGYQREQELVKQRIEGERQLQNEKEDREDARLTQKLSSQIESAKINALGRTAGRATDSEVQERGFNEISKVESDALNKQNDLVSKEKDRLLKTRMHEDNMDMQNQGLSEKMKLEWAKIKQKDRQLDVREKETSNSVVTSAINKN